MDIVGVGFGAGWAETEDLVNLQFGARRVCAAAAIAAVDAGVKAGPGEHRRGGGLDGVSNRTWRGAAVAEFIV
jgi:hypothetical protein